MFRSIARAASVPFVLVVLSSMATAQSTVKTVRLRPIASVEGKDVYREYCAHCHGDDLKGHGPNAAGLRLPPADLTTIALRNNGAFVNNAVEDNITRWARVPRTMATQTELQQAIDTGSKGAPVMPLFGPIFGRLYSAILDRRMRLNNLVSYIKSKQVGSTPPGAP